MMAKCKIQNPKKELEAIVLVYHDLVTKGSELMKDFEKKFLKSFISKSKLKPKHFLEICEGNG